MELEFFIVGGRLEMSKRAFVKDVMSPNSTVKRLLNYELEDGDKARFVRVDRESDTARVLIEFDRADNVLLGEDYKNLVYDLKAAHGPEVRGHVTLSAFYYQLMTLTLDLDSADDQVKLRFS